MASSGSYWPCTSPTTYSGDGAAPGVADPAGTDPAGTDPLGTDSAGAVDSGADGSELEIGTGTC
ncbi:hypothetical protein NUM_10070 [Actinocatenispora comari]|uniref:Uncharacterized protein n=1 Tax=Actinocatenispora comari TaxID=2807577 RepID=A0A8J4A7L1_9ACTN|nr:hypothetical protein NUM_10070 [Actinocatenispora comari]